MVDVSDLIHEMYNKACEEVVEKFGREEKIEYLKNKIKLKSFSEMIEEIDIEFDKLRSLRASMSKFRIKRRLKKIGTAFFLIDDSNNSFLVYPDDFIEEELYPSLLHELGHGLYHSYKGKDTPPSISETYAFAAENHKPTNFEVTTGKYLLDGLPFRKAFRRSVDELIDNRDIEVTKINEEPVSESIQRSIAKKYLKICYENSQKDHFKGAFLLDEIQKSYGKNFTKILGDALINLDVNFLDEKKFLETLKENY